MQFFRYLGITVVILALVVPADAGWIRKVVRKVVRGAKKVGKAIVKGVKKVGCKVIYGVGCPLAVNAAGAALGAGSGGLGGAIVAGGVIAGNHMCKVKKRDCKRSAGVEMVLLPFSDEMSDYDFNGDKLITYREFQWAVLSSVRLVDPDELMEPFAFADFDGNGVLDTDEFHGAPFLFAHVDRSPVSAAA